MPVVQHDRGRLYHSAVGGFCLGFEADPVDRGIDLGYAYDVRDKLTQTIVFDEIDRLKADVFGVSEPFLVHIADHDDRGAENARRRGGCEAHRPGACNVDRPQATLKGTETRSPISKYSTSRPFSITSLVVS
jgi:hypothetical protein